MWISYILGICSSRTTHLGVHSVSWIPGKVTSILISPYCKKWTSPKNNIRRKKFQFLYRCTYTYPKSNISRQNFDLAIHQPNLCCRPWNYRVYPKKSNCKKGQVTIQKSESIKRVRSKVLWPNTVRQSISSKIPMHFLNRRISKSVQSFKLSTRYHTYDDNKPSL